MRTTIPAKVRCPWCKRMIPVRDRTGPYTPTIGAHPPRRGGLVLPQKAGYPKICFGSFASYEDCAAAKGGAK